MPDHLSIEILGVLRGTADGPFAVGVLGLIVLAALVASLCRLRSTYVMPRNSNKRRPDRPSLMAVPFRR
jgi:hypothetical protein